MTENLLQQELETYEREKGELLAHAEGMFALIHDGEVVGTYNDQKDAITEGYSRFGNVPFLVKMVCDVESPANFLNHNVGV